jgi:hypothetical protein
VQDALPGDATIDREVVVRDEAGIADFKRCTVTSMTARRFFTPSTYSCWTAQTCGRFRLMSGRTGYAS